MDANNLHIVASDDGLWLSFHEDGRLGLIRVQERDSEPPRREPAPTYALDAAE